MKLYTFGREDAPTILLLPGTCCHWKSNFDHVIPLLEKDFRVLCVSLTGCAARAAGSSSPPI